MPGANDEAVTVVIVTYNSAELLPDLLASMPAACAGIASFDVVVADNASTDPTLDVVSGRDDVRVVSVGRNGGYAAGINAGVAAAQPTGAVLVLNPDIRLVPGSVRKLLDAAAPERVGITVPRLVDEAGTTRLSLRRDPSVSRVLGEAVLGGERSGRVPWLGELVTDRSAYERPGPVDWATGAAMLITRACREAVGAWDESFFLYSEETDYAIRARRAGFRIEYVPDATAVHIGGDLQISPRLWTICVLNKVRLYARDHSRLQTAAFRAAIVLNEATRAAAGREPSRAALRALLHPAERPPELDGAGIA
jgi:N-acetylglucosaminyl-diphospho-decaprenol L-rhamnosyltransferase